LRVRKGSADDQALKSLVDIRLSYTEDSKPGFKLHFTFGPNDFFEDTELTKTYYYQACHLIATISQR
jgi:nucleosome assembly protein 1-like 1